MAIISDDKSVDAQSIASELESDRFQATEERDEVKEVEQLAATETSRIQRWRLTLTLALVATAVAVTWTTYRISKNEQDEQYFQAVS